MSVNSIVKNAENDLFVARGINKTTLDRFFQIISILIFITSFLVLGFLISMNQKGFDITDEGFELLASQFPSEVKIWPNVAHIYIGLLFRLVSKNITALRILAEVLLFSSASFFFLCLYRLISLLYPRVVYSVYFKISAWSMMCLGALFYYIYFGTTPCYNTLNAILLYTASGFLCLSLINLTVCPTKHNIASLSSFFVGVLVGIIALVKFPTMLTITLLFCFILSIWPQISFFNRLQNISMILLGICTWILFHISFLQSWTTLHNTIHDGIQMLLAFGLHKPGYCFKHYSGEIINLFINGITYLWKIFFVFFVGIIISFLKLRNKNNLSIFFITLFFLAGLNSFALNFYKGGCASSISLMEIYTGWLLLFFFAVIFTLFQKRFEIYKNISSKRLLIIIAFLFLLPFAGAGGTANVITLNLVQYMAAWFGLITILLLFLTYTYNNRWIFLSGACMMTAFACSQIISGGFIDPYGLHTSIQYQTVSTAIGSPVTNLKLDKETSEFFNQINEIARSHGFKSGDDILAFCNMSGIVFALNGKSPVTPWYTNLPNSKKVNEWLLQQTTLKRIKTAFILQNKNGVGSTPDLTKFGIKFPADYVLCGQAIWPRTGEWVRLWKSKYISRSQ